MGFNQQALAPDQAIAPGPVAVDRPGIGSLAALVEVDPFSLPAAEQVELIIAWERHTAWLESLRADALTALAGPGPDFLSGPAVDVNGDHGQASPHDLYAVDDSICDEVAAALRVATSTARRRIDVARDLSFKLPDTRRLLNHGICSYAQAAAVSEECAELSVGQARAVEIAALGRVRQQTPAQTRRSVRRAIASICPPDPQAEVEAEFARREVSFYSDGPIMATITATVPAPDALAIWNALTGCAVRDDREDDNRTMAHKRADALTAWAHAALDDPAMPTMQGKKRLDTQLVITWETLIGLNDDAAEIIGYGPIPAHYARKLAIESSSWRRLITDPVTGHLLDYGTTTYEPPAALREYVIARDRTCQFPGCNSVGWRCDIDHVEPWTGHPEGGHTTADNLITLCRRHHRLKTHNRWRVQIIKPDEHDADSTTTTVVRWNSPRGQIHERDRHQIPESSNRASPMEIGLAQLLAA